MAIMANKVIIPFLVAMMLVTGVCNTLLSKYQVSFSFSGLLQVVLIDLVLGSAMCTELRLERPEETSTLLPASHTNVRIKLNHLRPC